MALKDVKLIDVDDEKVQKIQENFRLWTLQFNKAFSTGNLLEKIRSGTSEIEITIGTSTTLVPHGLGRKFIGWTLTDLQGDARVWRDTTSTADANLFLPLRASSSVKVKLWVF